MSLFDLVNMGGPINWVLIGLGFICSFQICERLIYFFQTRSKSKRSALKVIQQKNSQLFNLNEDDRKKILNKEGLKLIHEMGRGLWLLNFFANIAPTLGLLGTITGLIVAFQDMALSGGGDIQSFSDGIWQAMLTTAVGLIVSIPASLFHRFFVRLIEKRTTLINIYGDELPSEEKK